MNFTTFLVSSTNIFPLANSTAGGQLLSEWNLRSREMVSAPSTISFDAGHSFTHCDEDYKVALDTGDTDGAITRATLKIFPGRAIVNGHFVENLAPMYIDMLEANTELQNQNMSPLKGKLAIGIRAYYSTETTMAGTMEVENGNNKYSGVQLVILPEDDLKTPMDVPNDESLVTCHLKLATFTFRNGSIVGSSITQNPNKTKYIEGGRIFNINEILSDTYISRAGIHPNRLYVFAGKSTYNSETGSYDVSGKDTWCDATGSLMVWDSHTDINKNTTTNDAELGDEAVFGVDLTDDSIYLDIPHKQVDGMKNANGNPLYYKDKILKLPKADYVLNTPGTITPTYTKNIKKINERLSLELHNLVGGKQRAYRETLSSQDNAEFTSSNDTDILPEINQLWDVGDYVLIGQDFTVENSTTANAPSTIYAVIPGLVTNLAYIGYEEDNVAHWESTWQPDVPDAEKTKPTGVKLYEASVSDNLFTIKKTTDERFQKTFVSKTPVAVSNADNNPVMVVASYTNVEVSFTGNGSASSFSSADLANPTSRTISDETIYGTPIMIDLGGTTTPTKVELNNQEISKYPEDETTAIQNKTYYTFEQVTTPSVAGKITFVKYDGSSCVNVVPGNGVPIAVTARTANTRNLSYDAINLITGAVIAKSVVSTLEETSLTATYYYYELSRDYSDLFPDFTTLRGIPNVDYFVVTYEYTETIDNVEYPHIKKYYFVVTSATAKEWSSTIYLTGTIPLAEEDVVGGFYNISSDKADAGYVYRDDDGHLRLVDYGLLRTGLLAYQLGEDLTFPTSFSLSEVQEYLDEYVNDRIAFPNSTQKSNAAKNNVPANVIHIYIELSDAEATTEGEETPHQAITIRNIDSRFDTCVYFHFTGTATSYTTINIVDCQKIRIDPTICGNTTSSTYEGGPIINLYRTNLYYDAAVLNYIISADRNTRPNGLNEEIIYEDGVVYTDFYPETFTGMTGLSLWYQPYGATDPQIVVDDKTVSELDVGYISEGFDFWNAEEQNDTHYKMALSSISFDGTGVITKVGLLIADSSTNNIDPDGQHVFYGKFVLPQGSGLSYPQACIKKPLKITGNFVSAYIPTNGSDMIISNTNFTAETGVYDVANGNLTATGNIAILTNITASSINVDFDTAFAPWKQNTYNLFYGGTVC